MKCHICATLLETEYNYCPGCGDNLTPEPVRASEDRSPPVTGYALPAAGGRRLPCSNAEFERRCLVYLGREQEKLDCDNGLVAVLCDAVRLCREYSDFAVGSVLKALREDAEAEGSAEGHNVAISDREEKAL